MTRPIASWLREYFPGIDPAHGHNPSRGPWSGDACWIAITMCLDAEHNPPLYWLGCAFDTIAAGGATEVLRARLHAAHGDASCGGDPARDQAVQDALSEACAYAWASTHLGPPQFEADATSTLLRVPSIDAVMGHTRLRSRRSLEQVIDDLATQIEAAATALPPARGRIVYVDTWHEPRYAQGVGYRLELAQPLQHAAQHLAQEAGVGHVLTRPFQWGNPIDARY